ncbi:hypothetical protein [Wenjunlia tyrosinilytica]|uniref:Uncharacterized protein n=1 Tax=Wenjunlia tyrosinilytica TaxID=1544741 RepID=A0A917ZYG8_9ACTN|nr:hypothetical protein [Wenjunlia tyrosinilytica]GGP00585.1 hypothetical protein GCM10012280_69670 [Wenjunlia tyrosinilytica]
MALDAVNRDKACGSDGGSPEGSATCSGVDQRPFAFTKAFSVGGGQ